MDRIKITIYSIFTAFITMAVVLVVVILLKMFVDTRGLYYIDSPCESEMDEIVSNNSKFITNINEQIQIAEDSLSNYVCISENSQFELFISDSHIDYSKPGIYKGHATLTDSRYIYVWDIIIRVVDENQT
ncbi:hypothetical protein CI105_04580 [Candidatus Izimaplasma bacterium ZiA1]|uniref:hypothetical protein n=1 Tax=Candidatus Izimoplasma sp. ZiA1 TaxID=2024899 RepID=UPI000BAA5B10|nr:hypothetical protein CI105_04580 [Candidatus Izimaplasma bacterium ZiA1]